MGKRAVVHVVAVLTVLGVGVEAQTHTFRTATSVVALNVTVTDGQKLVTGLCAEDFEVYEDGIRQPVKFFDDSNVPLDLILLLDASSSMRDKMPLVHAAAREFMKLLRPGDQGAVVAFADRVQVLQGLTDDAAAIEAAITATEARGSTALHNALYISLKEFGHRAVTTGEVRRQAIAVLSDGDDTASIIGFDDVVNLARRTGVNIYAIALLSRLSWEPDTTRFSSAALAMRTLARETGAQSFFPSTVHELKGVYSAIAAELESQYSVAYAPTNTRADGTFRRILVRVTSNPSFRPRTRTGYTAEGHRATMDAAGLR